MTNLKYFLPDMSPLWLNNCKIVLSSSKCENRVVFLHKQEYLLATLDNIKPFTNLQRLGNSRRGYVTSQAFLHSTKNKAVCGWIEFLEFVLDFTK